MIGRGITFDYGEDPKNLNPIRNLDREIDTKTEENNLNQATVLILTIA